MTKPMPDSSYLNLRFTYCPDSGRLYWKEKDPFLEHRDKERKRWNSKHAGTPAGRVTPASKVEIWYYKVSLDLESYFSHRIIYQMAYSDLSETEQIDHIDGNGLNNRLSNLRKVDGPLNCQNTSLRSTNKSGRIGVHFDNGKGAWAAVITKNGVTYKLGLFSTLDSAIEARAKAEIELGFHQNHGRPKCKYS